MANSATVGILRVLLTGNSAELEAAYKRSSSATKTFLNELKEVQRGAQQAGQALSTALGKALDDAEKGTKGFLSAAKQLSGIDIVGQANAYAKAVEAIGGANRLTKDEQEKVNGILQQALAKYQALGREAPENLQRLAKETAAVEAPTSRVNSVMGDLTNQVKASALGFISAQAIINGVQGAYHALAGFLMDSVKAYAETEAAQKKLTTALQAAGRATPDVIAQYNDLGAEFQRTTVYSDDLIAEMQALLTEVGDVGPDKMQAALTAATNLASGLGIDLRQATMLVGKAFEGETGTLKRYGIVIDEAKLKTEGASAVLDAIQKKFGGQAQAEVETYEGKVKQLANVWNDLQEAVGRTIVEDPVVLATLKGLTGEVANTANAASGARVTFTQFWAEAVGGFAAQATVVALDTVLKLEQDIEAQTNKLRSLIKTPDLFVPKGMEAELQRIKQVSKETTDKTIEGWKKADAAAKAHAETIKRLREEISGRGLVQSVKNLAEALAAESKAGTVSADTLKRVADQAEKYRKEGALLTPELFRLVLAHGLLSESIGKVVNGLERADPAWDVTTDDMKETLAIIEKLIPSLEKVKDGLPAGFASVGATAKMTDKELEKILGKTIDWRKALDDTARSLSQLANVSDGAMSDIARGLAMVVTGVDAIDKSITSLKTGFKGLKSGDIFGGLTSLLSGGTGLLAGALTIGKALGGLFGKLFGRGDDGDKERDAFINSIEGGFDGLAKKLAVLGAEGDRLFKQLLSANSGKQASAAIDQIKAALERADKANAQFNSDLGGTLTKIRDLGGRLPESLKPYIDQLQKAGRLTKENLDLLAQLGADGSINWQKVEEAAGRYGISTDKLGQKFNELKLHDAWQQLIDDIELFADAGIPVETLLVDMADEISDLVQRSMKFGSEIPENMRPWIEKLIESGLLLDENGNKITDISKLKFGETLQSTLEKLNKTLELLLQNILGIGPAVAKQPKSIDIDVNYRERRIPDTSDTGAEVDRSGFKAPDYDYGPDDTRRFSQGGKVLAYALGGKVDPTQYKAAGGTIARILDFRPKGTDTVPAMLTPNERVLTPDQDDWLNHAMVGVASALNHSTAVSNAAVSALSNGAYHATGTEGRGDTHLHMTFTGPVLAEHQYVRNIVAPAVVDAINGNHLGTRTQAQRRSKPLGSL